MTSLYLGTDNGVWLWRQGQATPAGLQGKVFVRYEVLFQLAWVAGAFIPAILPLRFRVGILVLAVLYIVFGLSIVAWPYRPRKPAAQQAEQEAEPDAT